MPEAKFVELVTAAHQFLTERQEHLRQAFGLSRYERWDWDGERGAVVFSEAGTPRVIAMGQLVGSVSRKTGTWLWAWANQSIEPRLRRDLDEVRRYGEHHGIWQLTTPKWEADETDGWEMTSIAAYVLQAKGAYRMPNAHLFSFAIFDEVGWAGAGAGSP
jgi:hypothetical protein